MDERDVDKGGNVRVEEESVERVSISDEGVADTKVTHTEVSYDSESIENFEKTGNSKFSKSEEEILKERKEKLVNFLKKSQWWVLIILIVAVILGAYIRSMPMHDHGGRPGLWDITTNTWTLGPDLDPWLFLRNAKTIVEKGSLPKRDMMRNVPLGFDNLKESQLLPYMIAWTYYGLNFLGESNIEYAGVIFPVIMFALTIIVFFLFVREIFVRKSTKSKNRANIIAIISTFFMIVIPVFVSRTVAGIPEKESAAFFFMFLSYYLFLKAWKSKNIKVAIILGISAGITTGMMGLVWGGVIYIFVPIGGACLIAFILNKVKKKEFFVYGLWFIFSFLVLVYFSNKYSVKGYFTSLSSGLAFLTLFLMITHILIWNTKFHKIRIIEESKIPRTIISLIIAVLIILVFSLIFLGPSFLIDKFKAIHQAIFKPVQGRWNITVAENRQPNFKEWSQNFGPFIKNIPIMFWLFFIGSVVLFKKMLRPLMTKDAWVLVLFYIFLFFGLVFSRYSGNSVFNGENFISKAFYYISVILFIFVIIHYYNKYHKLGQGGFEKIRFEYLVLFALFMFTLFTARGAVRLIMVLGPIATIFVGFLIVELVYKFKKVNDEVMRVIVAVILILIIIASLYTFSVYYKGVKAQAYSFVPSAYNIQWQKAMEWVREETPENAVFGHWWDYGYWLQSIGNRATVLDGGNVIAYWNYLMGRYVLTGDNQEDALEYLYNHNTTHLLIDSTDIGKYTAFSSIGSDINYDRYSWMGTFLQDESQTQETKDQTLLVYSGGIGLDEDLIIKEDGKEVLLPGQASGVGAIILPLEKSNDSVTYTQPYIIAVYQGRQYKVNLKYLHVEGKFIVFKEGIEGAAFIFPRLNQQGGGINKNDIGAAIFISPRLFRGMLAQIYIMDDPLERFPNFNLVHTESSLVINDLRNQGLELPEFVYFNGVQGPIKIWEIEYTGEEEIKQEYLDTDYTKYISWRL